MPRHCLARTKQNSHPDGHGALGFQLNLLDASAAPVTAAIRADPTCGRLWMVGTGQSCLFLIGFHDNSSSPHSFVTLILSTSSLGAPITKPPPVWHYDTDGMRAVCSWSADLESAFWAVTLGRRLASAGAHPQQTGLFGLARCCQKPTASRRSGGPGQVRSQDS